MSEWYTILSFSLCIIYNMFRTQSNHEYINKINQSINITINVPWNNDIIVYTLLECNIINPIFICHMMLLPNLSERWGSSLYNPQSFFNFTFFLLTKIVPSELTVAGNRDSTSQSSTTSSPISRKFDDIRIFLRMCIYQNCTYISYRCIKYMFISYTCTYIICIFYSYEKYYMKIYF